jgi:site-specific recombinase XerD
MKTSDFQRLLQNFFLKRLMNQQKVSVCTVSSYRDTLRLLLRFLKEEFGIAPDSVSIHDIEAENILKFLDYLEHKRENRCETVNSRLAAIKSFWDYVSYECPEYLEAVRKVKMIPARKTYRREVGYLTKDEIDALLSACDVTTGLGRRDYLIVLLLFNSGMRVSEMTALKCWFRCSLP